MFAHFLPGKNNKMWKELLTCFEKTSPNLLKNSIKPVDSSGATVAQQNLNQKFKSTISILLMEEILHHLEKTTNLNRRVGRISSTNSPFPSPFHENSPDSKLGVGDDNWPPIVENQNSGHVRPQRFFPGRCCCCLPVRCLFLKVENTPKNHWTENYSLPGFCHMWVFFWCCLVEI